MYGMSCPRSTRTRRPIALTASESTSSAISSDLCLTSRCRFMQRRLLRKNRECEVEKILDYPRGPPRFVKRALPRPVPSVSMPQYLTSCMYGSSAQRLGKAARASETRLTSSDKRGWHDQVPKLSHQRELIPLPWVSSSISCCDGQDQIFHFLPGSQPWLKRERRLPLQPMQT